VLICLLQAAERLYYIYQTLLDTSKALKVAGSEEEQAHQEAADSFQVCPVSMLKYTLRLMHGWSVRESAHAPSSQSRVASICLLQTGQDIAAGVVSLEWQLATAVVLASSPCKTVVIISFTGE